MINLTNKIKKIKIPPNFFLTLLCCLFYFTHAKAESIMSDGYFPQFKSNFSNLKIEIYPLLSSIEITWPQSILVTKNSDSNTIQVELNKNADNSKDSIITEPSTNSDSQTISNTAKTAVIENEKVSKKILTSVTHIIKKHKAFALVPVQMYLLEWLNENPQKIKRNENRQIVQNFAYCNFRFCITLLGACFCRRICCYRISCRLCNLVYVFSDC